MPARDPSGAVPARLAALCIGVLAALGDPDEVDGLQGFEGFELWRQSRHR